MEKLIRYSRERGIKDLYGELLAENRDMLAFLRKLGFTVASETEAGVRALPVNLY